MNIYDLTKQQQALIDALFWEDDEEQESMIFDQLAKIEGDVKQKLEYLSTVLAELKATTEARKTAYVEAQKRHTIAENAEDRLKGFILDAMTNFSLRRIDGKHKSMTLCAGREKIVYPEAFDVLDLPEFARRTIVDIKPIAEEVKKLIEAEEIEGPIIVKTPYLMLK